MRILFIANDFPTPASPTKAVFNRALVRALATAGHGVEVIAPVPWPEEVAGGRVPAPREEVFDGVHVQYPRYWYPPTLLRSRHASFYWRSIGRAVRRSLANGRPDVVLGYWVYPDGNAAIRAAKLAGVPSALIVGGSDVLLLPRTPSRRRSVVDVLQRVDRVITVSRQLRSAVTALGIEPAKVIAWNQGIDPALFHPGDRAAARTALQLDGPDPLLLWVGRMVPVKGLEVLIEAAGLLQQRGVAFRLVLVGDGPLRDTVHADCAARGISDRVHFAGSQPPEALGNWYRAADRVLQSSWSEGLPNVLREAQACGIPFIASDVGGIAEIAGPPDLLFPAGNAAALADAVQRSLSSPAPASTASPTTWEQSAHALVELLQTIPAPRLSERAVPWMPRQLARQALDTVLPRRAMLSSGPRGSNAICLTFDDGPHEVHTPALLDLLREHGVLATFFVIGQRAERMPDLLRRIASEGHTIAHHTFLHGEPQNVSAAVLAAELRQCDAVFTGAGVPVARVFRPPYGKLSPGKLAVVWRAGLTVVLWSRDSKDYQSTVTPQELVGRFTDTPLRAGDIALFHELFPATVDALRQLIPAARDAGLSFTTVDRWTHGGPVSPLPAISREPAPS